MDTLLVKNADVLITMDQHRRVITHGGLFIEDNIIKQVDITEKLPSNADRVIDASGLVILPGLINTHNHCFQTLFRCFPTSQNDKLFDWLDHLFPVYGRLTDEAVYLSTLTSLAEMILSGCTTSSDHLYILPNNSSYDSQVRAAQEIGFRFHLGRGSLSLGKTQGGTAPDYICQSPDTILKDSQRLIEKYHDPDPYAMLRIVLAPCTPFTDSAEIMVETAKLGRSYKNVSLHTHIGETLDEVSFCLEKFGKRPARYIQDLGWVGEDVWWAHCIYVNPDEVKMMAQTGTGVAHCPKSNMRLGSGICRVKEMREAGVKVSIGVDGAASNDTNNVFEEARMMLLLQRVNSGASAMSVQEALEISTLGGASVLGRDDIGSLENGKAADFIGINLQSINLAGAAVHDPVASLLLCDVPRVTLSVINGKPVVMNGQLLTLDLENHVHKHNQMAKKLASE